MTKISTCLLGVLLALSSASFGQSSFVPEGSTAGSFSVTKLTETNSISASFFSGSINNEKALGLRLVNTSPESIRFSWTVRNKEGVVMASGENTTLGGGQMISALKQEHMGFVIGKDQQGSDFTIEITIK
jgi:hypothetical protein